MFKCGNTGSTQLDRGGFFCQGGISVFGGFCVYGNALDRLEFICIDWKHEVA